MEVSAKAIVLIRQNKVNFAWMPGHRGMAGNEIADYPSLKRHFLDGGQAQWLQRVQYAMPLMSERLNNTN